MRRPTRSLLCAAGLVLLLSACEGKDVPGAPTVPTAGAMEPSPSADASDVPAFGAPKVDSPIDISKSEAQPCETLTDAQINGLLGSDTKESREESGDIIAGPGCTWHSYGSQSAFVGVLFPKVTDLGLSGFYRAKGGQYKFFEEMAPVRGYPAVAWNGTDETAKGVCNVVAGTSDRATVNVTVTLSEKNVGKKNPCEAARDVLDMVIGNIQGVS
ncbi:DUF3558 domain-containing protein [Amycolatopsis sp. 195334CR]|uniref:DUF3558 domain-containing protein n=1 Tax=Amycolatopsis sp. 195334CR TaxID=2814588 RepID=UPI001A8DDA40|nr:DUF3558 domain-containing protein [Amycolatopsis sp. 195334CR]MBN6036182.1 DUF3558 domain-containing protein [Amycolatopsis sp. 195334CR]